MIAVTMPYIIPLRMLQAIIQSCNEHSISLDYLSRFGSAMRPQFSPVIPQLQEYAWPVSETAANNHIGSRRNLG